MVLSACPASADETAAPDDDMSWAAIDVSGPGSQVPPEIEAQSTAKMQVAEAYVDALYGSGTTTDLQKAVDSYQDQYGPSLPSSITSMAASRDASRASVAAATSKVLSVAHYAQTRNYYCGPASGRMILRYLGAGPSNFDGKTQTQAHIANSNHMKTSINGVTKWSTGRFRLGLNRWLDGKETLRYFYVDQASPSATQFKNSLISDVNSGHPFGADTVEFASSSVRYNHHPTGQTIGHWIVAHGYSNSGGTTYFADPSTSVWANVKPKFTYNTANFVNTFLDTNGITW